MFGRRFAYQFEGGNWDPRGHHHGHHHEHHHGHHRGPFGPGPQLFWMRRGRGPFGGPRGPFGPGARFFGEGQRFFGHGDVKYALLELLQERPMHGYEMMKALEERSGGFYTPSAGTIYPTLQLLEDRSLVTSSESEGKKVYSITDAGRAVLSERKQESEEFAGPPWARGFFGGGRRGFPELQALRSEAMEVARLFSIAARASFSDQKQLNRLRGIIERTRKELSDLIYNTETTEKETPASPSGPEQV